MITQFDDFCLWAYVVIDEIWQQIAPQFTHPGPVSACSDSELLTLALVGECRGWDKETELITEWQMYAVYSDESEHRFASKMITLSHAI